MNDSLLRPIEHEGLTRATIRVCIRLIVIDHRKNPHLYRYNPSGILDLAERLRPPFPELYGTLVYISKAVATGLSLAQVRHAPVEWAIRSIAKRRPVIAEH
jgi:hypothetical protein